MSKGVKGDWYDTGSSWLGTWRETILCGSNLQDLYDNEMNIRSLMNEYVSRGVLLDFKLRYKYPSY